MTTFFGFTNGANRYTLNIASTTWLMYSPTGDLVNLGGTCLGPSTNNFAEYHAVIGLLMEALTNDLREIRVLSRLRVGCASVKISLHYPKTPTPSYILKSQDLERYFE